MVISSDYFSLGSLLTLSIITTICSVTAVLLLLYLVFGSEIRFVLKSLGPDGSTKKNIDHIHSVMMEELKAVEEEDENEQYDVQNGNSRIIASSLDEFIKRIVQNPEFRNNHKEELKNIKELFENENFDEPDLPSEDDDEDKPWKRKK